MDLFSKNLQEQLNQQVTKIQHFCTKREKWEVELTQVETLASGPRPRTSWQRDCNSSPMKRRKLPIRNNRWNWIFKRQWWVLPCLIAAVVVVALYFNTNTIHLLPYLFSIYVGTSQVRGCVSIRGSAMREVYFLRTDHGMVQNRNLSLVSSGRKLKKSVGSVDKTSDCHGCRAQGGCRPSEERTWWIQSQACFTTEWTKGSSKEVKHEHHQLRKAEGWLVLQDVPLKTNMIWTPRESLQPKRGLLNFFESTVMNQRKNMLWWTASQKSGNMEELTWRETHYVLWKIHTRSLPSDIGQKACHSKMDYSNEPSSSDAGALLGGNIYRWRRFFISREKFHSNECCFISSGI